MDRPDGEGDFGSLGPVALVNPLDQFVPNQELTGSPYPAMLTPGYRAAVANQIIGSRRTESRRACAHLFVVGRLTE